MQVWKSHMQFKSTPTCQPAAYNDLGFLVRTHLSFWWNQSLINPVRSACQESALPTVDNSNGVNVNGVSEKSCSPRDTDSLVSDGANAKARNNASCSCWSAYQYKNKFIETSAEAMFATNNKIGHMLTAKVPAAMPSVTRWETVCKTIVAEKGVQKQRHTFELKLFTRC